jgi:hypothetical protein
MTIIIAIAGVFGASILLAIPFMLLSKKRQGNESQFKNQNKDKAILHLYSSKSKIDNADIVYFSPIKGSNGQKIVALQPGKHLFEGIFETTSIEMGKNVNIKSKKLNFELVLEAGHTYSLAVYLYSPEQRRNYYKGEVGIDVFSLALDIEGKGESLKAYVICYQEN